MTLALPEPSSVRRLAERALALPGFGDQQEHVSRLVEDYSRGVATEHRALVVALVGATGAGKSTLLNALVGAPIATPGDLRPTTAVPVIYAPDDAVVGSLAAGGTKVVRYSADAKGPWSGQVFVDTPDLNSVERSHRERARAVLNEADVALVVLHKGSVAEAVQAEFLATFAHRRRLLFVLNHADLLSEDARRVLRDQIRALAKERLGLDGADVYAISALAWVEGKSNVGERDALMVALRALGERTVAERIRRSNALGALRELQGEVRPALEGADAAANRRADLLGQGLTEARAALSTDLDARMAAASAHLGNAVRREAARRFWGPAGWWMRMTLAGSSGLGAAALLVRGNPLIAGGVALGSAIASQVQQFTLERSATQRMTVEALSDEATLSAARTAVAGARADAAQSGLSPEQAQIPSTEVLAEALARVRASAWDNTANLALAEAVQRWWRVARFILLPLVNLPLLALFAHVAWRVVRGYFEGVYVGGDFLLNAAALALLIAAAGAAIASITLVGVRRRVVNEGRRRFELALTELSAELVSQVRESGAEARHAARQLVELMPDS